MVRTPSFKEWFGESVVISEIGEPMIMYHGSKFSKKFTTFRTEYDVVEQMQTNTSRFRINSFVTKGTHFTNNQDYILRLLGPGKNIYRVFLSIKNPKIEDQNVTTDQLSREKVEALQQQGVDGIKTPEGCGVTYVAFEPEQILIISDSSSS